MHTGENVGREENQAGKLIHYERQKADMSLDELCYGLCSHTFLMRVEKGERACEKILSDALLQRVGVSADKFIYIINPEEQGWLLLREEMIAAVEEGNEEKARPLLEKYRKMTEKQSKLHRQLLLLCEVMLQWKTGGDRAAMLLSLTEAWQITMPDITMREIGDRRLTLTETVLVMMYSRIMEEDGRVSEAESAYERSLQYLEDFVDEEDSVKLYPQIAYRLAELYLSKNRIKEAVTVAEKAIAMLKVRGRMFYLRQFLEILSEYGELMPEERKEVRDICSSLKWLYETYGVKEQVWIWNIPFGMAEIELCGNLIRARREALGMSQEKLAEGICDPVSISRIERNEVTPKRQIFKQIMEKIGMTGGSLEAVTQVESPELFDLAVKISLFLAASKGREAEPFILELEKKMKHTDKFSRQFLLNVKAVSLYNQKKISAEEHADMQMEALRLTMPRMSLDKLNKWCFSSRESCIINTISYSYDKMDKREEIIQILQILQRHYENKPFALSHYVSGYELTMRNLGNVLGNAGRFEEAIEASKKGIRLDLMESRGIILSTMLYDCGWDMEQLWDGGKYTKEESLHYVKACYALELLFDTPEECEFTRRHLLKYYGETIL